MEPVTGPPCLPSVQLGCIPGVSVQLAEEGIPGVGQPGSRGAVSNDRGVARLGTLRLGMAASQVPVPLCADMRDWMSKN